MEFFNRIDPERSLGLRNSGPSADEERTIAL